MSNNSKPVVLVSDSLMAEDLGTHVLGQSLAPWLAASTPVWQGPLPLAIFVTSEDELPYSESEFSKLNLPMHKVNSAEELQGKLLQVALDAHVAEQTLNTKLRAEATALRGDFMALQQSFNVAEDFLYNAFAPQFMLAREWQNAGDPSQTGSLTQRLPVGSAGLVAVDIWATGAGKASLRFCRATGADFALKFELTAKGEGWVRAQIPKPLAGLNEDVFLEITTDTPLGLSHQTPLAELHAAPNAAPLALRVWRGLPEVRLPNMTTGKERFILPVSSLPEPEINGGGSIKRLQSREALSLHPGHNGKLEFVFRGVEVPVKANIAAYMQNFGPEAVSLRMVLQHGASGRKTYLAPDSHGQCDLDSEAGLVDLHFSLSAPSAVSSVYLRGVEFCPLAN